ncbi:DcuS/MalK family sensor histidine kinase [Priestia koreensis]|nr:DcuS/MalK family sensor histidine kinase [Priestia koreensis]MCM3007032.1 DcuS/MalK family sensor histidine kinase [Priestia koreensis]
MKKGRWSLQLTIMLLVCGVVAFSLFITDILVSRTTADIIQKREGEKAQSIGRTVAMTPVVIQALSQQQPNNGVQRFASQIKKTTGVEFIVVMDNQGIRLSHPDPRKIGKKFVGGDQKAVLRGKEHISISKGTLGTSLRSFTPVYNEKGKQVGAVSVGISLEKVHVAVARSRSNIYTGTLVGILVGVIGAVLLARYIKKILFGLEPAEISKVLEERSAILQSAHEGIIAVDQHSTVTLVNRAASKILSKAGVDTNFIGKKIDDIIPGSNLKNILAHGKEELGTEQDVKGVVLVVNRVPIIVKGQIVGALSTFRDKTEIHQMAVQLTGVRLYADALRAQSHEFMNKLHVILGMVHMKKYDQLDAYINELADHSKNETNFITEMIKDPVLAGFLTGKLSYAREEGVKMTIKTEYPLPPPNDMDVTHELITIIGNLIENAVDALNDQAIKRIEIEFDYADEILSVDVTDNGSGITKEQLNHIFQKGYSTKGENRGIGLYLVQQSLDKLNGELEISSTKGQGTRIAIYIPYIAKEISDE